MRGFSQVSELLNVKAARLGTDRVLRLEQIECPKLRAGGVIVSVLSTTIASYADEVLSGRSFHVLAELPTTPGATAIGIVDEVADDVFDLKLGQMVFIDPQVCVSISTAFNR